MSIRKEAAHTILKDLETSSQDLWLLPPVDGLSTDKETGATRLKSSGGLKTRTETAAGDVFQNDKNGHKNITKGFHQRAAYFPSIPQRLWQELLSLQRTL